MKVITIVDVNTLYSGKLCSFNTFYCFYEYVLFGVNRFCDILLVWQKFKSLWQLVKGLFSIWQHFEPTLANIYSIRQYLIIVNYQPSKKNSSRLVTLVLSYLTSILVPMSSESCPAAISKVGFVSSSQQQLRKFI